MSGCVCVGVGMIPDKRWSHCLAAHWPDFPCRLHPVRSRPAKVAAPACSPDEGRIIYLQAIYQIIRTDAQLAVTQTM